MRQSAALALVAAAWAAACTPALDWRELRPADSGGAQLLMPCRALEQQRRVVLAGRQVLMALHACEADGRNWALAIADMQDPVQVAPALAALRDAGAANIGATRWQVLPLEITGATPQPASARVRLSGRRADGAAVEMDLAVFARGTRVLQATVLGERVDASAAEAFFAAIRFTP